MVQCSTARKEIVVNNEIECDRLLVSMNNTEGLIEPS